MSSQSQAFSQTELYSQTSHLTANTQATQFDSQFLSESQDTSSPQSNTSQTATQQAVADVSHLGKFEWNDVEFEALLLECIRQCDECGMRADSGLKAAAWASVVAVVRAKCNNPVRANHFVEKTCINKYRTAKGDYKMWHELKALSGAAVCPHTGAITLDAGAKAAYIAVHPKARKFFVKPLKFQPEMDQLFQDTAATGVHVVSISSLLNGPIPPAPGTTCVPPTVSTPFDNVESQTPEGATKKRRREAFEQAREAKKAKKLHGPSMVASSIDKLVSAISQPPPIALTAMQRFAAIVLDPFFGSKVDALKTLNLEQKLYLCQRVRRASDSVVDIIAGCPIRVVEEFLVNMIEKFEDEGLAEEFAEMADHGK